MTWWAKPLSGRTKPSPTTSKPMAGVEPGGAVAGVAPQHRHALGPKALDHRGDQEAPEAMVLGRPVHRHAPELDGRPPGR